MRLFEQFSHSSVLLKSARLKSVQLNRNYQFWILQLVGWTGWVLLFSLRDAYWGQPVERTILLVIDGFLGILLTTALRYIYRLVWEKSALVRVTAVLVASYSVSAIWQPVKNFSQMYYYDNYDLVIQFGFMGYFNGILGYSYFLMLSWSGLYFALKFYQLLQEERQRSIMAESRAHESQLRMLRYQLNPHFLFNTLNAISTLVMENKNEMANSMVTKLGHFLRHSLDKDMMQKVDLEDEISTIRLYLDIEKVRFDDRLQVEIDIESGASVALVPSLLLQPLIENSIKYAVAQQEEGGKITINARQETGTREYDELVLEVIDDGPGMPASEEMKGIGNSVPAGMGVGLRNTQDRLRELYGPRHVCNFSPSCQGKQKSGLKIEIRIPFETDP